ITAPKLEQLGLIDKVIPEPVGGAHRDHQLMYRNLRRALTEALRSLHGMSATQLVNRRLERLMAYGSFVEKA
ncbi:hypothetical protein QP445_14710, partial [Micrococcus luteus]|nr:hypothetical protein [Micrococcus luteus]